MHPALGSSAQGRCGPVGVCPQNYQRSGAPLLRQAERAGVVHPGEKMAPGRSYCGLPVLKVFFRKGEWPFIQSDSDNAWGDGFKLKERFRLDAWKKYFTQRVVKQWHRLARKVVDAPSLEGLKTKLHGRVIGNRLCLMYLPPQDILWLELNNHTHITLTF